MNWILKVLKALQTIINVLFPKSRWGNIAYLILGFVIAQWEAIVELLEKIINL